MAVRVSISHATVRVALPFADEVWSFHGPMQIPLSCITKAYVSTRRDLHLGLRLLGTGAGSLMTAGRFSDDSGRTVFCDLSGSADAPCLVIEAWNYEFDKIALTLADGADPSDVAAAISSELAQKGKQSAGDT
jgi:hypothetical protein